MRALKYLNVFILGLGILITGCATTQKVLPRHDEVLRFNLPYDLTFLRTIEALERVEGWELQLTEKEKGVVVVRNINFSSLDDADKRNATFWIKRLGARETSVQLAPDSQQVLGGGVLLERISQYLEKELNK